MSQEFQIMWRSAMDRHDEQEQRKKRRLFWRLPLWAQAGVYAALAAFGLFMGIVFATGLQIIFS